MTTDGATHTLCQLIDLRSPLSMERISIVFRNLASHQGNVRRMVGAGVVPTLVAIASKGGIDTKIHCLIGLCLISFEPTVRLIMSEEGAIPAIMELSSYIGTRAAVHYSGMAISNIAAESKAQEILVKSGAISTLMAWMDQASHSGGHKTSSHHKRKTEEELMHEARKRVQVPIVEEAELETLSERFDEPRVKFDERSLPWRKFHIQLRVSEPEPPPLPNIQRPVLKKQRRRRKSATAKDKKDKSKPNKKSSKDDKMKEPAVSGNGLVGRPPNPTDVENEKILSRANEKLSSTSSDLHISTANEKVVSELRKKDNGSWTNPTNNFSISATKTNADAVTLNDTNNLNVDTSDENIEGSGGFEGLFRSMRQGEFPVAENPEIEEPTTSPPRPETGSPAVSPKHGSGEDTNGPPSPYDIMQQHEEDLEKEESIQFNNGKNYANNEIFADFETEMHNVRNNVANNTFGAIDFGGDGDFFAHLDSLNLKERGQKKRRK
jgi:hypothetical protein